MIRIRLSDLPPEARVRLGLPVRRVRRKVFEYTSTLPQPTPREAELQSIRHRLSLIAARLTGTRERIAWALGEIERERERLRKLGG